MDTSDERAFADSLRLLRERKGWSQGELARQMVAAGWDTYSQMTVSRTEKYERPIRLSEARALAHLMGSTVEEMIARADGNLVMWQLTEIERELSRLAISHMEAQSDYVAAASSALELLQGLQVEELARQGVPDGEARRLIERIGALVDEARSIRLDDLRATASESDIGPTVQVVDLEPLDLRPAPREEDLRGEHQATT